MEKRDVLLNTEAHRAAFNDFAAAFTRIEHREHWRQGELLRHWLDAAFRALRGKVTSGETWNANEAEYMKIVKRCRAPQETMRDFSVMLGCATQALLTHPADFIGPIFSAFATNERMGQFFTPYSLSLAMAEMTIGDAAELRKIASARTILLNEPACGCGGMMLAANEILRKRGIDPARQAHWVAVDLDYYAMCGAYIQAALTDASATIIHGNTLKLETYLATLTPAAIAFPKRLNDDERPKGRKGRERPQIEIAAAGKGQLTFSF